MYFFASITRHEFFLWICGTFWFFFQKTAKFHFLSEMSKNDIDIETVHSISIIPKSMQVIFCSSCSRVVFGYWELNLITSLEDPILKTSAIFEKSFGKFEVVSATPNLVIPVKLFCFRSII